MTKTATFAYRVLYALSAATFATAICAQTGNSDVLIKRPSEGSRELLALLQSWNQHHFSLEKNSLKETFEGEIHRLGRTHGDAETWIAHRMGVWEKLPPILEPQIPLSESGATFLVSMYMENDAQFVADVPDESKRNSIMQSKLYLILSLAQESAHQSKSEAIEPSDLFVAMNQAWTGLWPFCPSTSPKSR